MPLKRRGEEKYVTEAIVAHQDISGETFKDCSISLFKYFVQLLVRDSTLPVFFLFLVRLLAVCQQLQAHEEFCG